MKLPTRGRYGRGAGGVRVVQCGAAALVLCFLWITWSTLRYLAASGNDAGEGQRFRSADQSTTLVRADRPDDWTGPSLKVAYAITITKDGPYLDGAVVLKHSVDLLPSRHDVSFVAIVHPEVQSTRPALLRAGFEIEEFELPIDSSEIQGEYLRETIDKSGCCGASELLKLRAYQLERFDRVVLLDMDTLIVKSIEHLFHIQKEAIFTYDEAMHSGGAAPPVQGGFLVLKPNSKTFEQMIDIVREGDFRPGTGWAGTHIGWCWGGQTFQGLVSYYYNRISPGEMETVDKCIYNAMVSTKDCEQTPFDSINSLHFTVCQKPWDCRPSDKPLCVRMIKEWWNVRRSLERKWNLKESTIDGCRSRRREYTTIQIP